MKDATFLVFKPAGVERVTIRPGESRPIYRSVRITNTSGRNRPASVDVSVDPEKPSD